MPQVGESRTYQGETRTWNGSRWEDGAGSTVQPIASNEPDTWLGGFTKHLLTKEKGTVAGLTGLLGLLTGGAGPAAIGAAAPLVSEIVSRGTQAATGDPVEPVGLDTALNVASGPAMSYGPGLLAKGARAVARTPAASQALAALTGGAAGAAGGSAVGHPYMGMSIGAAAGKKYGGEIAADVANGAAAGLERLQPNRIKQAFEHIPEMWESELPARPPAATPGFQASAAARNARAAAPQAAPVEESLSPIEAFYRDNPMGEGRNTTAGKWATDSGVPLGEGGLDSLAALSKSKAAPQSSILHDMEESYGHGLQKVEQPWEADVPDFTFEGDTSGRPGEFAPGPAAEGFGVGSPLSSVPLEQLMASPSFAGLSRLGRR